MCTIVPLNINRTESVKDIVTSPFLSVLMHAPAVRFGVARDTSKRGERGESTKTDGRLLVERIVKLINR